MAVVKYYTTDDLLKRRVDIGIWIASQTDRLVGNLKYGQLLDEVTFMRYQYVVACHVALMGYEVLSEDPYYWHFSRPGSLGDIDGIVNGLTEANVDSMINNIEIITGLHFLNKETTYNTTNWISEAYQTAVLNSGNSITLNKTPSSQELIDHPHLGTGFLQLFATV